MSLGFAIGRSPTRRSMTGLPAPGRQLSRKVAAPRHGEAANRSAIDLPVDNLPPIWWLAAVKQSVHVVGGSSASWSGRVADNFADGTRKFGPGGCAGCACRVHGAGAFSGPLLVTRGCRHRGAVLAVRRLAVGTLQLVAITIRKCGGASTAGAAMHELPLRQPVRGSVTAANYRLMPPSRKRVCPVM